MQGDEDHDEDGALAPEGSEPPFHAMVAPEHRYLLRHAPIVPAGRMMPSWFRDTPNHFTLRTGHQVYPPELRVRENRTVKSCPGIVDYMTGGYVLPLWADYSITMDDDGLTWVSHQDDWPIVMPDPAQYSEMPKDDEHFSLALKFQSPWYIKTPPGYSMRMLPLTYHFDQQWAVMPGVIHTDVYHESHVLVQFHFRKGQVVLPQGMPFAHLVPFRRETYDLTVREAEAHELEAIAETRRGRSRIFSDPKSYPRLRGES